MAEGVPVSELVRLGGGREAEVYAWGDGRVLRLAHDAERSWAIEREAAALAAAASAGAPVPKPYESVLVDGRPGMIMERVDGENLLARLGHRPWAIFSIGATLGRLHARLHRVAAPPGLPLLRDELIARLHAESVTSDVREAATRALEGLPDGDRLYHGDYHPANVLTGRGDGVVIDWTNGASGHPTADVARTCLIVWVGELPTDAPARVVRRERAGRRVLLDAYLRGYRREQALDLALVERWMPVCVAARLADGLDAERATLLAVAHADADDAHEQPRIVPRARALPAKNRRWLLQNALAVTALVNLVLNAGIAWASASGTESVPLWSARVGETNVIADTVGTLFLLPLITCLLVTTAVWRELGAGGLSRLGFGDDRVPLLRLLPTTRLARGLALGAISVALLGPPVVACLALVDLGPLGVEEFVAYKAGFAVALGAIVTPAIALCAMADSR